MPIFSRKRCRFRMIIPAYPAFNIYSHVAKNTTALGPVCVATSVTEMEGWDVEIIDENNYRRYGPKNSLGMPDHEYLQQLRPADVVGFYGGLTSTVPRLYELAALYKGWGIPTIVGGYHFSVDENIVDGLNRAIDYVIINEGEEIIKELLTCLKEQTDPAIIKGIAFLRDNKVIQTPPREPITDFDKLPIPDFSLVRYAMINVYPVSRIRGCGSNCEFCMVKGKPRYAPAERLLEQISLLIETKNAREFFVVDDLFGQDRVETIRCCNMLRDYLKKIRKRINLTVQIRLDRAKDPELLQAMREARIKTVAIGFESPIKEELKAMNKHIKPEDMVAMTRVFHKFGFLIHGMFIFGYPMKDGVEFKMSAKERIKQFKSFINKTRIDTIQVLLTGPLPGTELRKRLVEQGRVYPLEEIGWEYYDGNFPLFKPDEPLGPEDMQKAAGKIMGKFYRFRNFFMIGITILSFPRLIFCLHDIKKSWEDWHREWRNSGMRFGGWLIMREWKTKFKKDSFLQKLKKVKEVI
ncbi:MAG: B12-binding domain-containing radical SAM protein [Candidatus Omnitrophica bacterium]|nr:B12-binding domain-containing radical SAM protein [Candidatus Omnitrophota bacterium]